MTNSINSNPNQSKLVVLNSTTNPELNPNLGGFGSSYFTTYFQANGTIIYANTNDGNCQRCATANTTYARTAEDVTILEQIADGTILLLNDDPEERLLVMQEQLFELLHSQPDLLANSNSLQQFLYNNQWTNLDFIHYAGQLLAENNIEMLELVLGFWPGQDGLDETYYQYFEWMVAKYYNPEWQPDEQIVLEYANRCPLTHGTIVYAIRNFYNAITGKIHEFENNCEPPAARGGNKPAFIRLKQPKAKTLEPEKNKLKLYPNPATNIVNINFPNIKQIVVTDITGRTVLIKQLGDTNNTQINVGNIGKGIFIVTVTDKTDKRETKKLIVQ